jgi:hypothetical protein
MKYLEKFSHYNESSNDELSQIEEKTVEYFKFLSDSDKSRIKRELEQFAKDNGVSFDDLQDPELVKSILRNNGQVDESTGGWVDLVDKFTKFFRIGSIITFIGGLLGIAIFGIDAELPMKIAASAFIISNLVACFKMLQ